MAEPLYCYPFKILCQPLSWWSSAASWAQAILSALAIFGASYIAKKQHDRVRRQQVAAICGTVKLAVDNIRSYKNVRTKAFEAGQDTAADGRRLDVISKALSSTPIHEIPDPRLGIWMFTVGEILAQAFETVEEMKGSSDRTTVEARIKELDIYISQAETCLSKVRDIDREHGGR